jgi:hypothetical protein
MAWHAAHPIVWTPLTERNARQGDGRALTRHHHSSVAAFDWPSTDAEHWHAPLVGAALQVNKRLAEDEKSGATDGDPLFPKVQWPPAELCPLCRLPLPSGQADHSATDVEWNEDEVHRFLVRFYGASAAHAQLALQQIQADAAKKGVIVQR